jgi:hypothetical protein
LIKPSGHFLTETELIEETDFDIFEDDFINQKQKNPRKKTTTQIKIMKCFLIITLFFLCF